MSVTKLRRFQPKNAPGLLGKLTALPRPPSWILDQGQETEEGEKTEGDRQLREGGRGKSAPMSSGLW